MTSNQSESLQGPADPPLRFSDTTRRDLDRLRHEAKKLKVDMGGRCRALDFLARERGHPNWMALVKAVDRVDGISLARRSSFASRLEGLLEDFAAVATQYPDDAQAGVICRIYAHHVLRLEPARSSVDDADLKALAEGMRARGLENAVHAFVREAPISYLLAGLHGGRFELNLDVSIGPSAAFFAVVEGGQWISATCQGRNTHRYQHRCRPIPRWLIDTSQYESMHRISGPTATPHWRFDPTDWGFMPNGIERLQQSDWAHQWWLCYRAVGGRPPR